jgi:hypothetical protein
VLAVWNLGYNQEERFQPLLRFYVLVDPQNGTGLFLHTDGQQSLADQVALSSSKSTRHVYLPLRGDEPLDRMVLYIYELKQKDFFTAALTAPNFIMDPK